MNETRAAACSDISTSEMAALTRRSVKTLSRWARDGHPAARWDKYRGEWRWLLQEYDRFIGRASKPEPIPEPQEQQDGQKKRGPKARLNSGSRDRGGGELQNVIGFSRSR